ncbi:MAG: 50S ribosomal protein L25 [Syntrophomonadaceae bacterium]|nr:50S ribosomal protein L25 [Syntrophomonadaceae bacterium]
MAETVVLACEKRGLKKPNLKQLRQAGRVPAVIYGKGADNLHVSLDSRNLAAVFRVHGARGIFSLQVAGEQQPVLALVREVQRHPLSGNIEHVDFLRVRMGEKISAAVPIVIHGEEEILRKGGILQAGAKEVEVECLPADLPDAIAVDISRLNAGDKLFVGDLQVPPGVKVLSEPESIVVTILHPAKGEAEAPPGAEAGEAETSAAVEEE